MQELERLRVDKHVYQRAADPDQGPTTPGLESQVASGETIELQTLTSDADTDTTSDTTSNPGEALRSRGDTSTSSELGREYHQSRMCGKGGQALGRAGHQVPCKGHHGGAAIIAAADAADAAVAAAEAAGDDSAAVASACATAASAVAAGAGAAAAAAGQDQGPWWRGGENGARGTYYLVIIGCTIIGIFANTVLGGMQLHYATKQH
ncbi:uncharacterized protein DNG_04456 [Cephalotrichum gorgonifer]|uniref:Uncharacterized protein n=1 Tax=Cephalotrichum gorgonifer TaxID=2041049 RepID=A0AAE8SUK1_9PEZI|nr:uncharacterized protein DNG_04456 [Cephalotrichum gorgonifer]